MESDYPDRYRTMGLKVAYYRRKVGYTQDQLAELVGISTNFLAQVESPNIIRGVSLEVLFKLADKLGVPPSKLLEDD